MSLRPWIQSLYRKPKAAILALAEVFLSQRLVRAARLKKTIRRMGPLQKFWMGGPQRLAASPREKTYFEEIGLDGHIAHCLDDYRCAAEVQGTITLPFETIRPGESVQLAFAWINRWPESVEVEIRFGDAAFQYRDLKPETWHDVRLKNTSSSSLSALSLSASHAVLVTMPRAVRKTTEVSPRHIVVCVLDSWSSQFLSEQHPFKEGKSATPNIDRFFASGFRAEHGVSSAEWTLPTVASLATGQFVGRHNVTHPRRWVELDRKKPTVFELFQDAGYHTMFASAASRLTPAFGFLRGIDRFLWHFPDFSLESYSPARWLDEIIGHIDCHSDDRTFSYIQFPDVHPIWDIPPTTRYFSLGREGATSFNLKKLLKPTNRIYDLGQQTRNLYVLRIAEMDRVVGCLLHYLETEYDDDAMVIVTSDHGVKMPHLSEEHLKMEPFLTDVRVQIPLLIRGPGIKSQVYHHVCMPNIDVPKILLEAARLPTDRMQLDGVNLLSDHKPRESTVSESFYNGIYELAVRGWEHVLFWKFKVDDVTNKPVEQQPFFDRFLPAGTNSYGPESDLRLQHPDIHLKLVAIAQMHLEDIYRRTSDDSSFREAFEASQRPVSMQVT